MKIAIDIKAVVPEALEMKELNSSQKNKPTWQEELSSSARSIPDLVQWNLIAPEEGQVLEKTLDKYSLRITPYLRELIQHDKTGQISKMALPSIGEVDPQLPEWLSEMSMEIYGRTAPWHSDPIGDLANLAAPRLTHRYENRALLHVSSTCALHCRFCFRKTQLNVREEALYSGKWDQAVQYLREHEEIREIILTGGDPLSLSDSSISGLIKQLDSIESIQIIRIHTRMLSTLPSRITNELVEALKSASRPKIIVMNHFNHPDEVTKEAMKSIDALRLVGIVQTNQSVLLRGVNDETKILENLFQKLYECGIIPIYLHYTDWSPGTFHFRVGLEKAKKLYNQMQGLVPGPALPRLILDLPGGLGKVSLDGPLEKKAFHSSEKLSGAVYEFKIPTTRAKKSGKTALYLDAYYN